MPDVSSSQKNLTKDNQARPVLIQARDAFAKLGQTALVDHVTSLLDQIGDN